MKNISAQNAPYRARPTRGYIDPRDFFATPEGAFARPFRRFRLDHRKEFPR